MNTSRLFRIISSKTFKNKQTQSSTYWAIWCSLYLFNYKSYPLRIRWDLLADSFILSLRCLISSWGHLKIMESDNGTNFVGAVTGLQGKLSIWDQRRVQNFPMKDIEWKFKPPLTQFLTLSRYKWTNKCSKSAINTQLHFLQLSYCYYLLNLN